MKYRSARLTGLLTLAGTVLFQSLALAQDSTITTTMTTDETLWYMQPWVWVVGGIALLLILISLFSGGRKNNAKSRTDKVIITKTVRTESDVD
jgi:hypothetical protein